MFGLLIGRDLSRNSMVLYSRDGNRRIQENIGMRPFSRDGCSKPNNSYSRAGIIPVKTTSLL